MALTAQLLQRITARAVAAMPVKCVLITPDGIRHEGTRGSSQSARTFRPEGFSSSFVLTFIGNASEFPKLPTTGTLCTVDSQRLEVSTVPEVDPGGGLIRIDFRTPNSAGA